METLGKLKTSDHCMEKFHTNTSRPLLFECFSVFLYLHFYIFLRFYCNILLFLKKIILIFQFYFLLSRICYLILFCWYYFLTISWKFPEFFWTFLALLMNDNLNIKNEKSGLKSFPKSISGFNGNQGNLKIKIMWKLHVKLQGVYHAITDSW